MRLLFLYCALNLVIPSLCFRVFDSRSPVVRSVIEQCVSNTTNEKLQCYSILRCIIDHSPSEVLARWSAGASILAFIPTITALLSNSINEVSLIADKSFLLAVALSLSSVTAFNARFRDKSDTSTRAIFVESSVGSNQSQAAWAKLKDLMLSTEKKRSRSRWLGWKIRNYAMCLMLFALCALVWYEVLQITRYGNIAFVCSVKVSVGIWALLSQLLTLLNVGCRRCGFDTRAVSYRSREVRLPTSHQAMTPSPATIAGQQKVVPSANGRPAPIDTSEPFTIILRAPSHTTLWRLLQTFTAVASFTLYTYGTVILASMTLIPASDAVRAMTVLAAGAGFARLVGSWGVLPSTTWNNVVVVDVPPDCMEDFHELVGEQARARARARV